MRQVRSFPRGGIAPPDYTALTAGIPIRNACVPSEALIPLGRLAGHPAQCLVCAGDTVSEGMLIGRAHGPGSLNVHASIPGTVREIAERTLPDGSTSQVVVIALEGEFALSGRARPRVAWEKLSAGKLLECIRDLGVIDLSAARPGADCLVVNGLEREPYLTCDQRLMIEQGPEIITGLRILLRILQPAAVTFGIEIGRTEALESLGGAAAAAGLSCRFELLQARYPQADEHMLVKALFGRSAVRDWEARTAVIGIGTLYSVYEAVVLGKPVMDRIVTVTGPALRRPANLKVRLGTRIGELIEECGGFTEPPARLVAGGPMTGSPQYDLAGPVTRDLGGVLAMSRAEIRSGAETPCIGCGRCLASCPWELAPSELYKAVEHRRLDEETAAGLARCTECGCCAYVCPAHLPLVQGLARGKALAGKA
jgi:electron transport complex protein RnfC